MELLSTVQAARYLSISRHTMRKLGTSILPPDSVSGSDRPYWHTRTLDRYRAGINAPTSIALSIIGTGIDGVSMEQAPEDVALIKGIQLKGFQPAPGTRAMQLIEVLNEITQMKPSALILPFQCNLSPYAMVVADLCNDMGIALVLHGKPRLA
ncbi:hypothetical protein IIE18_12380 [Pseudomonas sp. V1]|uniref:hypothetical protein n=1 Tax=Pseudomonas arcuscaelestis TaxID=2710591 RepID=UPI0019401770|nr:hypothetical protein [Pseudomonas arcuscaelestis]MBM3105935.1 hypothetical protein [Pseudomonas arcuscaelestis]